MTLTELTDFKYAQPDTMFVWGPVTQMQGDPPPPSENTFFGRLQDFIKTTTGAVAQIIQARQGQGGPVQPAPQPAQAAGMSKNTMLLIGGILAVIIVALLVSK